MLSDKLLFEYSYIEDTKINPQFFFMNLFLIIKEVADTELEEFVKRKRKPSFQQLLSVYRREGEHDSAVYKKSASTGGTFQNKINRLPSGEKHRAARDLRWAKQRRNQPTSSGGWLFLSESDTFDLVIQFCLEKKSTI